MDFIEGLPLSNGISVVFSVIDRLTKMAHFFSLSHPYSDVKVAQVFFSEVFRLHGMPKKVVSNRDLVFTSAFWRELFQMHGTSLAFSSSYHPQSDGQTEALNKCLEGCLRFYIGNTTVHASTLMSPFEALYGYPPPRLLTYISGTTTNAAVDQQLKGADFVTLEDEFAKSSK